MKVFCIGMFKTGTTSIGVAFEQLGFKTFNGPWWGIDNDPFNFNLEEFLLEYHKIEPILEEYEAFQDYPFMFIYPYLAEKYPDAKFILSERDPLKVAKSDRNMWLALGKKRSEVPSEDIFVDRYLSHNKSVKDFFLHEPERLLCIQVGSLEDLEHLQGFLGFDKRHFLLKEWPHRNKGYYGLERFLKNHSLYWKLRFLLFHFFDKSS